MYLVNSDGQSTKLRTWESGVRITHEVPYKSSFIQESLYMAKAFLKLRDPKLQLTSSMPFGKFVGCRVCDILEDNYEYVLWLHGKQPNLFSREVIEEAEQFLREALEKVHYEEEVKPFLAPTNNWFSDWDEDVPF